MSKPKAFPTRKRACAACRLKRRPNGHDPCMPDLPGVENACCGHGVSPGYIQFKTGLVLRGFFRRDGIRYVDGYYNPSTFAIYDVRRGGWLESIRQKQGYVAAGYWGKYGYDHIGKAEES